VNKVLGILSDDEAEDISTINLDSVVMRFANLHGKGYTADSLRTYKSRTKSSIDDFLRYVDNPMAFKIGGAKREPKAKRAKDQQENGAPEQSNTSDMPSNGTPMAGKGIVPIPIRADLIVHVQGLPFDLSQREAKKIANVILAMAMTDE
jgi:hypothetical protein